MSIFIKKSLKSTLVQYQIDYESLIEDFYYMSLGQDVFFFGRNVPDTHIPDLYHVHYLPTDDTTLSQWEDHYENQRETFSRTSDNLLFYTKKEQDYLILAIAAPNGHLTFSDKNKMMNMKRDIDNFIKNNIIP